MFFTLVVTFIMVIQVSSSYDSRYRVDESGVMGVTLSPEEMTRVRKPEDAHVTQDISRSHSNDDHNNDSGDFKKVYLDFLRSQLPTTGPERETDRVNAYDYENDIDNSQSYSYGDFNNGIGDAAKELKEPRKKSAKTLSAKCALEGGTCATFTDCDTTSHIYKGYCTTDYSAVCCVPRVTICQANDGICTDDREACVAAGEIMGRKYNLKFYTWMDCNSTHVCCRPSQTFTPPASTRKLKEITAKADDGDDTNEIDVAPTRSSAGRKRKPVIGKKVRALKGFQDAVNPDFAGYPESGEAPQQQQTTGRRRVAGGRMRPNAAGRRRVNALPVQRQVAQALPPGYGVPYPGLPAQSPALPSANQYLSSAYGASPYSVNDYMAAYAAGSPGAGSVVSGYSPATSYSQSNAYGGGAYQAALMAQANPQAVADTSQPQTNSLFGNIFL